MGDFGDEVASRRGSRGQFSIPEGCGSGAEALVRGMAALL